MKGINRKISCEQSFSFILRVDHVKSSNSEIMKCIVILLVFFSAANHITSAEPIFSEDYNDDQENLLKIESGADGKKTENTDFCWITAYFLEKQKSCGCIILAPNYVATTARCVYE